MCDIHIHDDANKMEVLAKICLTVRLERKTLHYTGVGTLVNATKRERVSRMLAFPDRWRVEALRTTIEAPASAVQQRIDATWEPTDDCYYESTVARDAFGLPTRDESLMELLGIHAKPTVLSSHITSAATARAFAERALALILKDTNEDVIDIRMTRRDAEAILALLKREGDSPAATIGRFANQALIAMGAVSAAEQATEGDPAKLLEAQKRCFVQKKSIAQEAHDIVTGPRAAAYGSFEDNFTEIADILNAAFGIDLAPTEIIKVMIAVKLGRDKHKAARDNPRDLIGYYIGLSQIDKRYEEKRHDA